MKRFARPALITLVFSTLAVGFWLSPVRSEEKPSAEINLVPIKFNDYLDKIAADKKAKLTVVDAWATWCGPCKENFPHVVEMHKKYADKGLKVISLSLDDPEKPKKVAEAAAFLKTQGAVFTNLLLDETPDDAFEKLKINAIPAVFLFGPDGKEIKRFTLDDPKNQFTYDDVEKAIREHLGLK